MLGEGFTITGARKGIAFLQIMDVYDEDMKSFGPEFISNTWTMGVNIGMGASLLGSEENYGNNMIGNWYAGLVSFFDRNTTENIIKTLKLE